METKIFISYSTKDKIFVDKLANDLKAYNFKVWYAEWEMHVGDSLIDKISEGLEESSFLVIVLSSNSASSEWVRFELKAVLQKEIETKDVIILPVLYEDCKIPMFLKDKIFADFREEFEFKYNEGLIELIRSIGHHQEKKDKQRKDSIKELKIFSKSKTKITRLFTSESVTKGHPDKVADLIVDSLLDQVLQVDPYGKVSLEVLITNSVVFVSGEVDTRHHNDFEIQPTVHQTLDEIGYVNSSMGLNVNNFSVIDTVSYTDPDISRGVTEKVGLHREQGAGDQGSLYGFACKETSQLMPMPIMIAHELARRLDDVKKSELTYLGPDGKTQVTIEYAGNIPVHIHTIVISTQHLPGIDHMRIIKDIKDYVVYPVIPKRLIDNKTIIHINPGGEFTVGGPVADTGLSGRKVFVDSYGGYCKHSGGVFSGKDPTNVDRSGAYMCRYIAKNIVASGLAERCEVHLAYAIAIAKPVSINVETFGTSKYSEKELQKIVNKHFNCTSRGIIEHLKLLRPIYKKTACYGHFGRDEEEFNWEKTDRAEILRKEAGL